MDNRRPNRKHSKIDQLTPELRETVEQMILTNSTTYEQIVQYLQDNGVGVSISAVGRYAKQICATAEMLEISQKNFRLLMSQMDKYPNLDTTEAIVRLTSQQLLSTLSNVPEEGWQSISVDKLLNQAIGLTRAAAYKKRVEAQNQTDADAGFDSIKSTLFGSLAQDNPKLYDQVVTYLQRKQEEDAK